MPGVWCLKKETTDNRQQTIDRDKGLYCMAFMHCRIYQQCRGDPVWSPYPVWSPSAGLGDRRITRTQCYKYAIPMG